MVKRGGDLIALGGSAVAGNFGDDFYVGRRFGYDDRNIRFEVGFKNKADVLYQASILCFGELTQ